MTTQPHGLKFWGIGGGLIALTFAILLLGFPIPSLTLFAWPVEPRLAQIFIGAGYIFRTGFFFSIAFQPAFHRVRWLYWGNLVFTGTLLLATFWNLDRFNLTLPVPTAHIWIILYIVEPVIMLYLVPRRGDAWTQVPTPRGPVLPVFKWFLVAETAICLTVGLLLLLTPPTFANDRWPWELNKLDAQIIAAWFLGWATWAGTMAFAADWDEIRLPAQLNMLFGVAIIATIVIFFSEFDFTRPTTPVYIIGTIVLTGAMAVFYWLQERRTGRS